MVKTLSSMLPLGTKAPAFELLNPHNGQIESLQSHRGQVGTLIMFICNHCPFVKHITTELVRLGDEYPAKGVAVIAINANDVDTYPDDSPDNMALEVQQHGYAFPYLYDESQQVAKAYHAECTPDFFLFDADLACVYRGQLDESRPGNSIPVSGNDLRSALDALVAGEHIPLEQKPSMGCNIKWKSGQ